MVVILRVGLLEGGHELGGAPRSSEDNATGARLSSFVAGFVTWQLDTDY